MTGSDLNLTLKMVVRHDVNVKYGVHPPHPGPHPILDKNSPTWIGLNFKTRKPANLHAIPRLIPCR